MGRYTPNAPPGNRASCGAFLRTSEHFSTKRSYACSTIPVNTLIGRNANHDRVGETQELVVICLKDLDGHLAIEPSNFLWINKNQECRRSSPRTSLKGPSHMKTLPQSLILFLVWSFALFSAKPATPGEQSMDAAIQAVQQAPDPSAAIAAYAKGLTIDRNNPRLYDAYVSRMVDLGLPEMAYHQAQTLTTLQSNNGLAWGVVAYVDARRGQMPEAISAINLAGQFAPDNKFVEHTAGEIVAWYDLKADKANLPLGAKEGVAK